MATMWCGSFSGGGCVGFDEDMTKPWIVDAGPGIRTTLRNRQGFDLAMYSWPTKQKKRGVVIMFHGIDVNTRFDFLRLRSMDFQRDDELEGSLAAALNEAGFDAVGADMQSYGQSQGPRTGFPGYFEEFDDILDDSLSLANQVANEHPDMPIFLLGISFGGLVAASVAAACAPVENGVRENGSADPRRKLLSERLAGLMLLAPALSLEKLKQKPTNAVLLPIVSFLAAYAPTFPLGEKAQGKYPQILDAMIADSKLPWSSPHRTGCYEGKFRARVGKAVLDATDDLRASSLNEGPTLHFLKTLKIFIIHSDHDTMTDPEGSREFANAVDADFITTQHIPGCDQMWHCLTQEPGCEALFDRLCLWLTDDS